MATKPKQVPKIDGEAESPSPGKAGGAKKSKKGLIIIILAVVLLGAAGGGGWFFFMNKKSEKPAETKKVEAPVYVPLETFTVNLQGPDSHLLQTNITLQLAGQEEVQRLKDNMPLVKNRLVLLLSSKKIEELNTAEGKSKLAQEIANEVKVPFAPNVPELKVSNVLFTSFIIQ